MTTGELIQLLHSRGWREYTAEGTFERMWKSGGYAFQQYLHIAELLSRTATPEEVLDYYDRRAEEAITAMRRDVGWAEKEKRS